jgi:glycosidase
MKGITEKVPYLSQLGVDAVWLSPFYPSALKDGGCELKIPSRDRERVAHPYRRCGRLPRC